MAGVSEWLAQPASKAMQATVAFATTLACIHHSGP
jgi:hypothetical protein